MTNQPNTEADVWAKVERTDACWLWRGYLNGQGYGSIRWMGRQWRAHRLVYELTVGSIPPGLTLDHLCRVRHCVNPDHLEPVTNRVNLLRGESPSARHARKTHCPLGHEYTIWPSESCRRCSICMAKTRRARYAAAKAERGGQ